MHQNRLAAAFLLVASLTVQAKDIKLASPDGRTSVTISVSEKISYSVSQDGTLLLAPSEISMTLGDGSVYGQAGANKAGTKLLKTTTRQIRETIHPYVYKKSDVANNCNETTLRFRDYSLVFRAYDDGVAYRFISASKVPFKVVSEKAEFAFAQDWNMFAPYTNGGIACSFENTYTRSRISEWDATHTAFLPLMVATGESKTAPKINILEADLFSYPCMQLQNFDRDNTIEGCFAAMPDQIQQGGHNMLQGIIQSRHGHIAECKPGKAFPWRIISISRGDAEMADNDMVCRLSTHARGDWSWVRPGKVAWDWWNDWNVYGVDFEAGINNATYKYYIDFAAASGIEYVILDEGWAVNLQADMLQIIPEIDLRELSAYAAERGVGLILWAGYWAFNRDMENVCRHYAEMGIKGYKVDFMDRDDQPMTEFYERAAQTAAKYHQVVDFHGAYKPTGLHFTYPNVLNFEGVHGLEQMKWEDSDKQIEYDVTIPYIRMAAGPMDYTQGAMRNATKANYHPVNTEPMSLGTRCHQLGMYIVYESPFSMLCDSPSNYLAERECLDFIASVPTVWDETRMIDGQLAEYVITARRSGRDWYIGGITNWTERDVEIDLAALLGSGTAYTAEIFRDGVNAHRAARDYRKETVQLSADAQVKLHMAPGGGFVIKISAAE